VEDDAGEESDGVVAKSLMEELSVEIVPYPRKLRLSWREFKSGSQGAAVSSGLGLFGTIVFPELTMKRPLTSVPSTVGARQQLDCAARPMLTLSASALSIGWCEQRGGG
jgi:hypothetical protein